MFDNCLKIPLIRKSTRLLQKTNNKNRRLSDISGFPKKNMRVTDVTGLINEDRDQIKIFNRMSSQMLRVYDVSDFHDRIKEATKVFELFNKNVDKFKKLSATYKRIKFHSVRYTYGCMIDHMYIYSEKVIKELDSYGKKCVCKNFVGQFDKIELIGAMNETREHYREYWAPHEINRNRRI